MQNTFSCDLQPFLNALFQKIINAQMKEVTTEGRQLQNES